RIPPITIEAWSYRDQTGCGVNTGELSIIINGDTDFANYLGAAGKYEIAWYAGNSTAGTLISNDRIITDQPAGSYTVEVENLTTFCTETKTFTIHEVPDYPSLSASADPVTMCGPNTGDGSVYVAVIDASAGYTLNWYSGVHTTEPNVGLSIGNTRLLENLDIGFYTVFVNDNGCPASAVVEVENKRMAPEVIMIHEIPLTNCDAEDPSKSNGQLSATVNGSVIGYKFDWFLGSSPVGNIIYTGATLQKVTNTT